MARKFKTAEILAAIDKSGGNVSTVARRLNCDWHTAKKYIDKTTATREAFADAQETFADACENVIMENVIKNKDTADAKWWLSRRRRDKFAPRQEVTGADGKDLQVTIIDYGLNGNSD